MSRYPHLLLLIVIILLLSTSSCDAFFGEPFVQIPGIAETLAAQTITAQKAYQHPFDPTATNPIPTNTITPVPQTDNVNVISHNTPSPEAQITRTSIPTLTPDPLNPGYSDIPATIDPNAPCNAAQFIRDVTIPDNTLLQPREKFTKIWAIRNVGTCTWDRDEYSLVILWGQNFGTNRYAPLHFDVPPGTTADLAIDMEAPIVPGCYVSNWMLQDGNGDRFGVGPNYKNYFWVEISVWFKGVPKFSAG